MYIYIAKTYKLSLSKFKYMAEERESKERLYLTYKLYWIASQNINFAWDQEEDISINHFLTPNCISAKRHISVSGIFISKFDREEMDIYYVTYIYISEIRARNNKWKINA